MAHPHLALRPPTHQLPRADRPGPLIACRVSYPDPSQMPVGQGRWGLPSARLPCHPPVWAVERAALQETGGCWAIPGSHCVAPNTAGDGPRAKSSPGQPVTSAGGSHGKPLGCQHWPAWGPAGAVEGPPILPTWCGHVPNSADGHRLRTHIVISRKGEKRHTMSKNPGDDTVMEGKQIWEEAGKEEQTKQDE